MGKGRKPVPEALKILRGNPGKRSLTKSIPRPRRSDTVPPAPRYLPSTGRTLWKQTAEEMYACGMLTKLDLTLLEGFVQTYATWRKLVGVINRKGHLIDGTNQIRPEVSAANQAMEKMKGLASELGLSPAARERLTALPPPERTGDADSFDQLRRGGVLARIGEAG